MAILIPNCLTDMNHVRDIQSPSAQYGDEIQNAIIRTINNTSRYIERWCQRQKHGFKYKSISNEEYDGKCDERIILRHYPLITLTSIYDSVSGAFDSTASLF